MWYSSPVSVLGTVSLAGTFPGPHHGGGGLSPRVRHAAAASTLAGNAVGEGSEAKLMGVSRLILLVAVLLMTCTGALLFLFPGVMLSLFTPDQAVIAQGAVVLRIIAVTEPIYAAGIIWEGVFNGVGDTRAPFVISMGTTWGVRILLTALCVHVFHLGLPAVWVCMALDNISRAALLGARFLGPRWKRALNLSAGS